MSNVRLQPVGTVDRGLQRERRLFARSHAGSQGEDPKRVSAPLVLEGMERMSITLFSSQVLGYDLNDFPL